MKPRWDRLEKEYENHESLLIGAVDCTSDDGKNLCKKHEIKGFPTLKFGDPNYMEIYRGKRDYESLKAHIQLELVVACSPGRLDLCTPQQKVFLDKYMEMGADEFEEVIDEAYSELIDEEEDFEERAKIVNRACRNLKNSWLTL